MNDILHFPIVTVIEDELGQKEEVRTFNRQVFCKKICPSIRILSSWSK